MQKALPNSEQRLIGDGVLNAPAATSHALSAAGFGLLGGAGHLGILCAVGRCAALCSALSFAHSFDARLRQCDARPGAARDLKDHLWSAGRGGYWRGGPGCLVYPMEMGRALLFASCDRAAGNPDRGDCAIAIDLS